MQLTDWLVVIFIVAIVGVLVDGVRRKLTERRNRVVLKIDKNLPADDVDIEQLPNSELPNGGARTLVRDGQPAPSLRTLQSRRKLSSFQNRRVAEDPGVRAVPVLLDAVNVEEDLIEHTNVFADPHAVESDFSGLGAEHPGAEGSESFSATVRATGPGSAEPAEDDAHESIDGLDEEYEEDAMLAEPTGARKESGYMDTRYQGRDDEDDDLDEEEFDDEEEDEDDDELDDDLESPDEFDDDDEDEDEEDDDDLDDDDDDFDDEEDDDDLDDDDEEEDDEEEDEDDLDELEGLPEDDWGEEEESLRLDDYENEPMPLQGAFDKAASTLDKAASQFNDRAASTFDKAASAAAGTFDKAANAFNRPPRQGAARIEPGFGADAGGLGAESFDDTRFSEDFSAAWTDEADAPTVSKVVPGKRDQGELFRESATAKEAPREENRLMAALQKAVPARSQPAQEPAAPVPQEVIIINVMARAGMVLHGGDLLTVLQGQGLRLGDMSIFHRHADSTGSGPVMFSMANMVKPGTFDLGSMEAFSTPGVSFFLQMPNKLGNMACFEKMLGAASAVRDAFDAELKDEHRSVFTRQTVEHCRQRVRDFELKLLSRK